MEALRGEVLLNPHSDTSPTVDRILSRVDEEIAADRRWRAREILQGSIRTHGTNPRILKKYGLLLESLGDRVEAGKYLFLSGHRGPEAEQAIQVFLSRHANGQWGDLVRQFPRAVREVELSTLPPVISKDLEALGLRHASRRRPDTTQERASAPASLGEKAALLGCALVGAILVAATIIGLGVIIDKFFDVVGS